MKQLVVVLVLPPPCCACWRWFLLRLFSSRSIAPNVLSLDECHRNLAFGLSDLVVLCRIQ